MELFKFVLAFAGGKTGPYLIATDEFVRAHGHPGRQWLAVCLSFFRLGVFEYPCSVNVRMSDTRWVVLAGGVCWAELATLSFRTIALDMQLRLGKAWWDAIGIAAKGSKTRVQWRHAVIKLALRGEVKISSQDIKKSLSANFSPRLDEFEAKMKEVKDVFVAHADKVSKETLFKMLLSFCLHP